MTHLPVLLMLLLIIVLLTFLPFKTRCGVSCPGAANVTGGRAGGRAGGLVLVGDPWFNDCTVTSLSLVQCLCSFTLYC